MSNNDDFAGSCAKAILILIIGVPLMFIFIMTCAYFGWLGLGGVPNDLH